MLRAIPLPEASTHKYHFCFSNDMTRKEKFWSEEYKALEHDEESLRFASNEEVARYRAKRLACDHLIEIGAGIGFQTIAFARTCKRVTAIEIDLKRIEMLKANLAKLKLTNVTVIEGDALDKEIVSKLEKADVVFCDPERAPQEEERSLDRLKPSPKQVISVYKEIAGSFCFEAPPQIKDIPSEFEKEYVSLGHKLNRLNLYMGSASKGTTSVMLLPEGIKLAEKEGKRLQTAKEAKQFIYEVDDAVVKAGLIDSLDVDAERLDAGNRTILTSDLKIMSHFLTGYQVLATSKGKDELRRMLGNMKAKKVIIKYPIDPEKIGEERRGFEGSVQDGKRDLHLFASGSDILIAEIL